MRLSPFGPWKSGSVREGEGGVPWADSSPLACSEDPPGSLGNTQPLPLAAGVPQACRPRGHGRNARAPRTGLLADAAASWGFVGRPPGA